MDVPAALATKLASPVFPGLGLWHGLGFAMVLGAGRRPLWLALPYGLLVGFAATILTMDDAVKSQGWWLFVVLSAAMLGCGLHFHGQLRRALYGGPTGIWLLRLALACAFPFIGPVFALMAIVVVLFLRRHDRLDLLD